MSFLSKPTNLILLGLITFAIAVALIIYIVPFKGFGNYQKPEAAYEYYYVYAEEDGRELMRVPVPINIDDELITDDNKRYKIISVDGNKGIARFVENVNLEKYIPQAPTSGAEGLGLVK